jgi:hypothetical protein
MGGNNSGNAAMSEDDRKATLVVLVVPIDKSNNPSYEAAYRRSFLRQKLIRGWIGIAASFLFTVALFLSLIDRFF